MNLYGEDPPLNDMRTALSRVTNFFGPTTQLQVGPNKDVISAHTSLLQSTSHYFRNATKPEWSQNRDDPNAIDMSNDDVDTVKTYVNWLYTRKIAVPAGMSRRLPSMVRRRIQLNSHEYPHLAKSYVFGEAIQDASYKNAIIKTIILAQRQSGLAPLDKAVEIIYKGTPESSLARQLLVHIAAAKMDNDILWTSQLKECPSEFILDILNLIMKIRPPSGYAAKPWNQTTKYYLEKEDSLNATEDQQSVVIAASVTSAQSSKTV